MNDYTGLHKSYLKKVKVLRVVLSVPFRFTSVQINDDNFNYTDKEKLVKQIIQDRTDPKIEDIKIINAKLSF